MYSYMNKLLNSVKLLLETKFSDLRVLVDLYEIRKPDS